MFLLSVLLFLENMVYSKSRRVIIIAITICLWSKFVAVYSWNTFYAIFGIFESVTFVISEYLISEYLIRVIHLHESNCPCMYIIFIRLFNPLSTNFTKWSNTLKQFVGNLPTNCLVCLTILWDWRKG